MAVVEAERLVAVVTRKAIVAHAPAVHAPAVLFAAGHRTDLLAAVSSGVAFKADADPIHTLALVIAVAGTGQLAAVLPGEALIADALPIEALASQMTVAWTFGLRAVGAFPARFADTATSLSAEVAPATAEGSGVQAACGEENRGSQLSAAAQFLSFYLPNPDSNLARAPFHPQALLALKTSA